VPRRTSADAKPRSKREVLRLLGAQLRHLRLQRSLSQERLAELAGLSYKYLGRIELAKADPGADVLVRLARALTVAVGDLFETITPTASAGAASAAPPTLSTLAPADLDAVTSALVTLSTVVDRVRARQAGALPARAPRRSRR
jgi:transcriptional regulator with XRE-family HTH domain